MIFITIRNPFLFYSLCLCLIFSCKENTGDHQSLPDATTPATHFQSLLDKIVARNDAVPGIQLGLRAPSLDLVWEGAAGVADVKSEKPIATDQPFRIASVTKTFVAVAILRLMEMGKLQLSDPIGQYLKPTHRQLLLDGGYDPEVITIRQALNHTSGLYDYALGGGEFVEAVKANPQYPWTRTEQLSKAMIWGKAYGAPGERYRYSDTGYILLGEIIEQQTGESLGLALRTLLNYEALGLKSTWLESIENPPIGTGVRIHQYLEKEDTYDWHPSFDLYGGGGLVSTTADLTQFFYQLFNHEVFDQNSTLDSMLLVTQFNLSDESVNPKKVDYRQGIEVVQVFNTTAYMHTGFWGTQVVYLPSYETALALNFVQGSNYNFLKKLIAEIAELHFAEAE
ncbi:MAG: serine hydrolase domain-containing protein [Bacteroidota bacterium]